jgi:hypothetical protein
MACFYFGLTFAMRRRFLYKNGRSQLLITEDWESVPRQGQMSMSKNSAKGSNKTPTMPGNVRAVEVISLVDEIEELGTGIHVSQFAEKTGYDIEVLLPILEAAEMLGLVRSEGGKLFLTEEGLKFEERTMTGRVSALAEKLKSIEPFRTAIELASNGGRTTAEEVSQNLAKRGTTWHYEPETNESLVSALLIHWTIRAGILSYDGEDRIFRVPSRSQ